jgi:predicted phosphodiesterase
MRLAVPSDIHAHRHALEAVWADLDRLRPNAVYSLRDLVGCDAFPNEVIEFVRERQRPTRMGNCDEGVGFDLDDCGCAYRAAQGRPDGDPSRIWSQPPTTAEHNRWLPGMSLQPRLEDRWPSPLLVHGSPRNVNEYVYQDRPLATFERSAALAGTEALLLGHTHRPHQKRLGGTLFVNVGSVGKPHDGDARACYAVVDLGRHTRVELRRVAYGISAAAGAIRLAGLPGAFAGILEPGGPPAVEGESR